MPNLFLYFTLVLQVKVYNKYKPAYNYKQNEELNGLIIIITTPVTISITKLEIYLAQSSGLILLIDS